MNPQPTIKKPIPVPIRNRLIRERKKTSMTARDISRSMNAISVSTQTDYERGVKGLPRDYLQKLLQININPVYILTGVDIGIELQKENADIFPLVFDWVVTPSVNRSKTVDRLSVEYIYRQIEQTPKNERVAVTLESLKYIDAIVGSIQGLEIPPVISERKQADARNNRLSTALKREPELVQSIGGRLRLERVRARLSQRRTVAIINSSALSESQSGSVTTVDTFRAYERGETSPRADILAELDNRGMDAVYILTGVRKRSISINGALSGIDEIVGWLKTTEARPDPGTLSIMLEYLAKRSPLSGDKAFTSEMALLDQILEGASNKLEWEADPVESDRNRHRAAKYKESQISQEQLGEQLQAITSIPRRHKEERTRANVSQVKLQQATGKPQSPYERGLIGIRADYLAQLIELNLDGAYILTGSSQARALTEKDIRDICEELFAWLGNKPDHGSLVAGNIITLSLIYAYSQATRASQKTTKETARKAFQYIDALEDNADGIPFRDRIKKG